MKPVFCARKNGEENLRHVRHGYAVFFITYQEQKTYSVTQTVTQP